MKNIPNFETKYPHITNFSVMVFNLVSEYSVLERDLVNTRVLWDGYKVEEILEHEWPEEKGSQIGKRTKQVFKNWKKVQNIPFAYEPDEDDENGEFIMLTFWCPNDGDFERLVLKYLLEFKEYLLGGWSRRGADDDYYDYLPSITDVLYQLCEYFGEEGLWKDFINELEILEGPEVFEEAIYRYKM